MDSGIFGPYSTFCQLHYRSFPHEVLYLQVDLVCAGTNAADACSCDRNCSCGCDGVVIERHGEMESQCRLATRILEKEIGFDFHCLPALLDLTGQLVHRLPRPVA
jgi:hypothetical protein